MILKNKNAFLAILFILTTTFLLVYFRLFTSFSNFFSDVLMINQPAETDIVIVGIDDISLKTIGRWPWDRDVQAQLINLVSASQPQVIGYDITLADPTDQDDKLGKAISNAANFVLPENSVIAGGVKAHVQVVVDRDGKARTLRTSINKVPSFSVVLARLTGKNINQDFLKINYRFGSDTFPMISAKDVLASNKLEELKNKLVLIGITARDLQDVKDTPLGLMNGVEVQANALDTIVSQRTITTLPTKTELIISLVISLLPFIFLKLFNWKKGLYYCFFLSMGIFTFSFILFILKILLPLFYWQMALVIGLSTTVVYKAVTASKERRFISRAFKQYVSPQVLEEILENPKKLSLTGQEKNITVMFLDIRGFTSYSEKTKPVKVVDQLNQLLELASNIIVHHQGTIDKYIGDCIMAFWGAPLKDSLQASHACKAALAIYGVIESETDFKSGIGINTGLAVVGNIGSSKRFDYTAIGDTVNLASRLESSSKELKFPIVISEKIKERLGKEKQLKKFKLKDLGKILVKGKKKEIKVWGLKE